MTVYRNPWERVCEEAVREVDSGYVNLGKRNGEIYILVTNAEKPRTILPYELNAREGDIILVDRSLSKRPNMRVISPKD